MNYITRACPYCGETIVVEPENIPSDIVMTQGRTKNMTTLAHMKCVSKLTAKNRLNAEYGIKVTESFNGYADTDSVRKGD